MRRICRLFSLVFAPFLFPPALSVASGGGVALAATAKGLRVEYRTTGVLPGSKPNEGKRTALQTILVDPLSPRLLLEENGSEPAGDEKRPAGGSRSASGRKFVLRSDKSPPVIWEILEGGKLYREHSGDLNENQKDRRIQERNEIELAKKLTPKEYAEWRRENPYLRPDGSRELKVVREPGEKILERQCEHILVTE